jgi:hypothetical protein
VAELADAPALGAGGVIHEGSSPSFRTIYLQAFVEVNWRLFRVEH